MNTTTHYNKYRFSGDESFICRYAWLTKALEFINDNLKGFADEDNAMVSLGVGKNMVKSIRFWAEATSVLEPDGRLGLQISQFGDQLLGPKGHDPYPRRHQDTVASSLETMNSFSLYKIWRIQLFLKDTKRKRCNTHDHPTPL